MKIEDIVVGEIYIIRNSKAEVLAIKNGKVVYWDIVDEVSGDISPSDVYPIKTPAETLRDETIDMAIVTVSKHHLFRFDAQELYDAGMLVKPCQKIDFNTFRDNYRHYKNIHGMYKALKPYMNTKD